MIRYILALTLLGAFGVSNAALHQTSAEVCGTCHQQIYKQWSGSMHAQASALKDPIHGAFYRKTVGDPTKEGQTKDGKYPVCLNCHTPAAAMVGTTKLDAVPVHNEGITCVSCHTMKHFRGTVADDGKLRLGVKAYEFSDTALQGPLGSKAGHPFPIENNPGLMRTNDACLGCHDQRPNSNKVALCQTGAENASTGAEFVSCQSCHMAVVNGKADHSMLGGHSEKMVQKGIVLSIDAKKSGDNLDATVSVHNKLPHKFPTGAPFRNFYIVVTAEDATGKVLWRSADGHPMKSDPKAMFMYKLGDEHGKPAPPPKATQVLGDSRLSPNETRLLQYQVPAAGVAKLRAVAEYDLLLPPIKKSLGDKLPKDLAKPRLAGMAEINI